MRHACQEQGDEVADGPISSSQRQYAPPIDCQSRPLLRQTDRSDLCSSFRTPALYTD